ncbi:MAG: phosphoglycerate dehydrogenase [Chloroflexota bacterium]
MHILVAEPIAQEGLTYLQQHAEVDVRTGLSPEALGEILGQYEALIVRSETRVTAALLEHGQRLRVVGRAGVGVDTIDVAAATQRGIIVLNAPAGNVVAAAEHALALLLATARNIPMADRSVRAGKWERSRLVGVELTGSVLGIIGYGKIGHQLARRAQGMELRVVAYDPYASAEEAVRQGVALVSLDDLLRQADFISIHAPLLPSTRGLLGMPQFRLMKRTAILVNCARGGILIEDDLLAALDEGLLARAALDVYSQEPPTNQRLLEHPKLVLTPHLGASTVQAQSNVAVEVAHEVIAALADQPVANAVNLPALPADELKLLRPWMALADLLGRFVAGLTTAGYESVEIGYAGALAERDPSAVRASVLKGLLERVTEERVNMVNARLIAERRGLGVRESHGLRPERYSSLLTVTVRGRGEEHTVYGTILEDQPHVVFVDGYWVDVVPTGHLVVIHHHDQPGMIGHIGSLLGEANINISAMHVGRFTVRGEAVMILALDEPLTPDLRESVLNIPYIQGVQTLDLGS